MLIASNADLVPLPPDKAGQADGFPCLVRGSRFLPAHTLALLQGGGDRHLSFLPCLSSFGKFISMAKFPGHLQKEPREGLSTRAPRPRVP